MLSEGEAEFPIRYNEHGALHNNAQASRREAALPGIGSRAGDPPPRRRRRLQPAGGRGKSSIDGLSPAAPRQHAFEFARMGDAEEQGEDAEGHHAAADEGGKRRQP